MDEQKSVLLDEANVTDIELLPDGRILVFGTSVEVLEVLSELPSEQQSDLILRRRKTTT